MTLRLRARTRVVVVVLATALLGCHGETPRERQSSAGPRPTAVGESEAARAEADSMRLAVDRIRKQGNRLVDEPSPYLRQHAHDPVDWYPWGPEALNRAEREGKPIFLSIGYSTCHWCHVMEEESFQDDEVAIYLNANFIAIKVDREQRPDLDAIFSEAVSVLGAPTGWPLTVFLTPAREPFFGGTYFPRNAKNGQPGFLDVLESVHSMFDEQGARLGTRGRMVLEQVRRRAMAGVNAAAPLDPSLIGEAIARLVVARDEAYGGFGGRQKFPQSPLLLAHLRYIQRVDDPSARRHLVQTLEAMMHGGIHDVLAGSFHRYAVDSRWHLPHFEKTLYDNAQLAALYIDAGLFLGRDDFVAVGRAVLDDLLRAWQLPEGGFAVGFDADDPAGEGRYYSWTPDELAAALPAADAGIVAAAFGVTTQGEGAIAGRSVLHRQDDEATAALLGIPATTVQRAVARSLPKLAKARSARSAPAMDHKSLVAWNGLAIMALADAARWLDEPRYREAAVRAGRWILDSAWAVDHLQRGTVAGLLLGDGMLDDHALAGLAFVRLHAATGDLEWLAAARRVADQIVEHFLDSENHVFLQVRASAADGRQWAPFRRPDFGDSDLPSGGAAAILFLLEIGAISGDERLYDAGMQVLTRTAAGAVERPHVSGTLLVAVDHATAPVREVVVAGGPTDPNTDALCRVAAQSHPRRALLVHVGHAGLPPLMLASFPALEGKGLRRAQATAYVCERGRCEAPTSDPQALRRQLAGAMASVASER